MDHYPDLRYKVEPSHMKHEALPGAGVEPRGVYTQGVAEGALAPPPTPKLTPAGLN